MNCEYRSSNVDANLAKNIERVLTEMSRYGTPANESENGVLAAYLTKLYGIFA